MLGAASVPLLLTVAVVVALGFRGLHYVLWAALLPLLCFTWLRWFRLDVDCQGVRYRRPFHKAQALNWADIANVEFKQAILGYASRVPGSLDHIIISSISRQHRIVVDGRILSPSQLQRCVGFIEAMRN